ncbi:hypothetical protein POVCU1_038380 [Plasmodium ovale curtisi]|uniref:Uncharacterized protein n=1 Tax=Plasmodium ovale curtisi TaxID=864141 RepID=A0A1A8WWW2_PLAOA|nr:hypothetical protein POVCU1_038380 [Plasmodium ovale curtisi]
MCKYCKFSSYYIVAKRKRGKGEKKKAEKRKKARFGDNYSLKLTRVKRLGGQEMIKVCYADEAEMFPSMTVHERQKKWNPRKKKHDMQDKMS